jgi:CDGSH-type Zn-finger protein
MSKQFKLDNCNSNQKINTSTLPIKHEMYLGAYVNEQKCYNKTIWNRQNPIVVDIESEVQNRTRPLSRCGKYKYKPFCEKSPMCTSTFDPSNPVIYDPSVLCGPPVRSNLEVVNSVGYSLPSQNICGQDIPIDKLYVFYDTCTDTPLYEGR